MKRRRFLRNSGLALMGGSAWSNPGPATQVIVAGPSGEFLVYSGPPAAGNLILAISGVAGSDAYGNQYAQGLTITSFGATIENLSMYANNALAGFITLDPTAGTILLNSNAVLNVNGQTQLNLTGPMKIGSGPIGKYYQEKMNVDTTQVFATGVQSQLTNLTINKSRNDYASAWNLATGVWTCPVSGAYRWTFHTVVGAWVAGSRLNPILQHNGTSFCEQDVNVNARGRITVCAEDDFVAGDTVTVNLLQATAANKSLLAASYIHTLRTS